MTEECKLCGGTGEVTVTPCGAPDEDADSFGCPCCITKERDEGEAKLNARIAELERVQNKLVKALRLGPSVLHADTSGEDCLCSQCEFVRARVKALAAVKGDSDE